MQCRETEAAKEFKCDSMTRDALSYSRAPAPGEHRGRASHRRSRKARLPLFKRPVAALGRRRGLTPLPAAFRPPRRRYCNSEWSSCRWRELSKGPQSCPSSQMASKRWEPRFSWQTLTPLRPRYFVRGPFQPSISCLYHR